MLKLFKYLNRNSAIMMCLFFSQRCRNWWRSHYRRMQTTQQNCEIQCAESHQRNWCQKKFQEILNLLTQCKRFAIQFLWYLQIFQFIKCPIFMMLLLTTVFWTTIERHIIYSEIDPYFLSLTTINWVTL